MECLINYVVVEIVVVRDRGTKQKCCYGMFECLNKLCCCENGTTLFLLATKKVNTSSWVMRRMLSNIWKLGMQRNMKSMIFSIGVPLCVTNRGGMETKNGVVFGVTECGHDYYERDVRHSQEMESFTSTTY